MYMGQAIYLFVALIAGLLVGGGIVWLVQRNYIIRFSEQLAAAEENLQKLLTEHQALLLLQEQLTVKKQELSNEITRLSTTLELERSQTKEKLNFRENTEKQLSNQFRILADEILEEKSKKFTDQNKINLDQLLEPLKIKISEFQGKVQEVYIQEGKDRSALAQQVKQLMALNNQLSDDAHNLTRALKGQSKAQGNWGELILERVLEASGLRKGHEYNIQVSHVRDDGTRVQPDVVIHLPENRHLIIDAKVSLTAYEAHTNAESDTERNIAIKKHLDSVRSHIKELSEKNYQHLYGLQSFDFVLMFVPVEPAFMLAISQDNNLWLDSWKKNILLVSPSTLLFVVRTVAHLWKQEQQNRNAQEIANRGAELYNKLSGFVDDLNMLGKRLQQAQIAYDDAYSKFSKGKGNVIRQAEMLKHLGVKPAKSLSQNLTNDPSSEDTPTTDSSVSSFKNT